MLFLVLLRFRGSASLDTEAEGWWWSCGCVNLTEFVAGKSAQDEDVLAKVQVLEASTLSLKAAGIWHPSRETEAGPFRATIRASRTENRIQ